MKNDNAIIMIVVSYIAIYYYHYHCELLLIIVYSHTVGISDDDCCYSTQVANLTIK